MEVEERVEERGEEDSSLSLSSFFLKLHIATPPSWQTRSRYDGAEEGDEDEGEVASLGAGFFISTSSQSIETTLMGVILDRSIE